MFYTKKYIYICSCALLIALDVSTSTALAKEFRVNLIATLNDYPAMERVEWTVYQEGSQVGNMAGQKYKTLYKHSTHMDVPSGVYKVTARLKLGGEITIRSRKFHVRNDTQVVVPMD